MNRRMICKKILEIFNVGKINFQFCFAMLYMCTGNVAKKKSLVTGNNWYCVIPFPALNKRHLLFTSIKAKHVWLFSGLLYQLYMQCMSLEVFLMFFTIFSYPWLPVLLILLSTNIIFRKKLKSAPSGLIWYMVS